MRLFEVGERLPPHHPNCFGCGPRNESGLHLRCHMTEEGVAGSVRLERRHEGGPGVAHGGIVAAVLDDVLGYLLYRLGVPMVTARLEVDYRRPVPLELDFGAAARILSQEGRKVWAEAELELEGTVHAQARGLFVRVDPAHWMRASAAARESIESWSRAGGEGEAGPGPVGP